MAVVAASPKHLLAMKLEAARPSDVGDIGILLRVLRVRAPVEAESILAEVFPDATLKLRARLILEDILATGDPDTT